MKWNRVKHGVSSDSMPTDRAHDEACRKVGRAFDSSSKQLHM